MAAKRDYIKALDAIFKRFDRLEAATVREMIAALNTFRLEVNGLIGNLSPQQEFEAFRLPALRDDIDKLIVTLQGDLNTMAAQGINNAADLGLLSVTEPLKAAGITTFYNRPTLSQINTMIDFSADLIRNIGSDIRTKINGEITRIALGGISPYQAKLNVNNLMGMTSRGTGKRVARGIGYNAERIVRTETNRAFNLASWTQMGEVERITPDAMKRWNATGDVRTRNAHILAHGQLAPVDGLFTVGGEKMRYPLDPRGSAANTINCRCRPTIVHPEIGVVGGPLDGQVARERKRREEMETA